MAPGSPPCIRRLPLIAGAAREESSQSLQCTGFRRRPHTHVVRRSMSLSFFTQLWALYSSYIGHSRKRHFRSRPVLNALDDDDLDDEANLQQDAPAVPCLPSELPGHHHRAQAQRGCCASELVGSPSRMDRHPVACLGCHGQSCRSDPPPATPELRSVAQDLTMPGPPQADGPDERRCRHRGRAPRDDGERCSKMFRREDNQMNSGNEKATSENSPAKAEVIFPSEVSTKLSVFDRFATYVSARTSQAWFFVVIVVLWAPSFFLLGTIDTWQLIINTVTTIVTFLLVALLQNTQKRSDDAVQHKLNAIADGLADLMKQLSKEHPELDKDLKELRLAVGLEDHESAS